MDDKDRPSSFLDLLERMKTALGSARKTGGTIEGRQKSLTGQGSSPDEEPPQGEEPPPGKDD